MTAADMSPTDQHESELDHRQCGRCRESFADDPTLHKTAGPSFWLCAACLAVLLPGPAVARSGETERR